MPNISIIIVTYKRLDYLKLTVASILNQTYKDFELIIVADGYQQDVKDFVDSMQNTGVRYSYVEHCGYPAKGRNHGIMNTSAPYIAFCDDDDIWEPDKIEQQLEVFKNNANLNLCCTNRAIIDSNGKPGESSRFSWVPKKNNLQTLLVSNFVCYSSVLMKREILDKTKLFPEDIRFKAIEDFHLWLRVAHYGDFFFLNKKLVQYRIHEGNITTKISIGIKRSVLVYNDIFKIYHFKLIDRIRAYGVACAKYVFYKLARN